MVRGALRSGSAGRFASCSRRPGRRSTAGAATSRSSPAHRWRSSEHSARTVRSTGAGSGCSSSSRAARRTRRTTGSSVTCASASATVRIRGDVGRCAITTQNPETGDTGFRHAPDDRRLPPVHRERGRREAHPVRGLRRGRRARPGTRGRRRGGRRAEPARPTRLALRQSQGGCGHQLRRRRGRRRAGPRRGRHGEPSASTFDASNGCERLEQRVPLAPGTLARADARRAAGGAVRRRRERGAPARRASAIRLEPETAASSSQPARRMRSRTRGPGELLAVSVLAPEDRAAGDGRPEGHGPVRGPARARRPRASGPSATSSTRTPAASTSHSSSASSSRARRRCTAIPTTRSATSSRAKGVAHVGRPVHAAPAGLVLPPAAGRAPLHREQRHGRHAHSGRLPPVRQPCLARRTRTTSRRGERQNVWGSTKEEIG